MSSPFLGEIRVFGFNVPPRGWYYCNGQLISIAQNTALFSLLGTTYGGNGTTTFQLPNLQGAAPVHFGQGSGLSDRVLGETAGETSVVLNITEIPQHNHLLQTAQAFDAAQQTGTPSGTTYLGNSLPGPAYSGASPPINATFSPKAIGTAGGGQGHNNIQPILALNFCIANQGVYPARN